MAAEPGRARPIAWACVVACGALALACTRAATSDTAAPAPPASSPASVTRPAYSPVQIEMRNVHLHAADGIVLDIVSLRGEMISRRRNQPPVFDDQTSYVLHVFEAEMSMDMNSLTHLMNDYLFSYDGAPLHDITMETDGGRLRQKATLRKGLPIPISLKASVSVTDDGRLRLETEKVSALGVPAKTLLQIFGLELGDVVDLKNRRGIEIDGNDVILSPGQILPPPEIRGRLSSVTIAGGRLLQRFSSPGSPPKSLPARPDPASRNYIFFSGSVITFGHLTMNPAELQLIDADPKDPFDFFPSRYEGQLVAGYSKNMPNGGLETYMPDYGDLARVKDMRPAKR